MALHDDLIGRIDRTQRRTPVLGLPFAVVKKFGDDRAAALAAQLTYYGFLSLFPLLLILTTILGFIGNESVSDGVIGSTLAQFPVFGEQIGKNAAHPISGNGLGLIFGILVLLYGALGSAQAAQHAMAQVWNVPGVARPGFFPRLARGLLFFTALGVGMGITTALSALVTAQSQGSVARVLSFLAVLGLNMALYLVVFRILTPNRVSTHALVPGAVLGGIGYSLLLSLGTALVQHQLRHAQAVYGQFGFVLGLMGWLYLVSQLSLYAAELNVVVARRLWPRGVTAPLTDADKQVLRALVHQEERKVEERVTVGFVPEAAADRS
jgi:YihY family inner membrane protein